MARRAALKFTLSDGRAVGAGFIVRDGFFRVRFADPVRPGRYVNLSTGVAVPRNFNPDKDLPPPDFDNAAAKIISKVFGPTLPPDPKKVTWDTALAELAKGGHQSATLTTYETAVANIRATLVERDDRGKVKHPVKETTRGPGDITPQRAKDFARWYASDPFKRGKASDAPTYTRTAQTVFNAVANLSIVWNHFREFGYAADNPFEPLKKALRKRIPHRRPTVPDDDNFATLLTWIDATFPGWELPKLFIDLQAVTARRLRAASEIESHQLDPKKLTVTVTAKQDKTNREFVFPVPPALFARLWSIRGPRFLWERYVEDTKTYRPGPMRTDVFTPSVVYNGMKAVFRMYKAAHPDKVVKNHDLRRRAITLTTIAAGGNIYATAEALGITPDAVRNHYLDHTRAFDRADLMKKVGDVLSFTPA